MSKYTIQCSFLAGLLIIALSWDASAQDETGPNSPVRDQPDLITERLDLITDRPDQTESAEVVPLYRLQIETGILHEWEEAGNDFYIINAEYGSTLLRFGIHRILEVRLATGLKQIRAKIAGSEAIHGMAPVNIGLKAKILKENGIIPDMALIAGYQIPNTGKEEYSSEKLIQSYLFAFAHTLSENWGLGYNLGFECYGSIKQSTFTYSLVFGYTAGQRLGIYLETYGTQHRSFPLDARVDAGLTYRVRPNLQLDLSGGIGISEISPAGFISTGVSWRIPR